MGITKWLGRRLGSTTSSGSLVDGLDSKESSSGQDSGFGSTTSPVGGLVDWACGNHQVAAFSFFFSFLLGQRSQIFDF